MTDDISPVGVDPDGPGDLYYPFADLRLHKFPAELRITRELQGTVATAMKTPASLVTLSPVSESGCACGRSRSWSLSWWR